jgi:DNA-binding transcriptional ArsR family regulator
MGSQPQMQFLARISPQFDFCYALADLVSPAPNFVGWPGLTQTTPWLTVAKDLDWAFWLGLPDLIEGEVPARTSSAFLNRLSLVPNDQVLPRLRHSLIHQRDPKAKPSIGKREWLQFIGLENAHHDQRWTGPSDGVLDMPLGVLRSFQTHFDPVWTSLLPQIEESLASAKQLANAGDLAAIVRQLDLALEIDQRAGLIRALRGGFTLPAASVERVFLMPSPFNSRRLWNAFVEAGRATLYLPYFLPDVRLPEGMRHKAISDDQGIDPWLVCRAIGDPSRAAILRLVAERPRSATELMGELGLSKATMSHHIFQLREAGLILERRIGRSREISVCLTPVRALSQALERELVNKVKPAAA